MTKFGGNRTANIQLNIGCGPIQPEGWINIDNSNRAKMASYLPWVDKLLVWLGVFSPTEFNRHTVTINIQKGLPFESNSVSVIYCGEMLEHFVYEDGLEFLKECVRVIKPGGILRVRVPDNYRFWKNYIEEFERTHLLPREQWNDEHTRWIKMFFQDICVKRVWLKSFGHFHKWMYDEISLIRLFEKVGVVEVERKSFHDSRIPDVDLVENRDDLIVEGIKP